MAISFNQIPLTVNTPGSFIEFDSSRAVQGLLLQPHVSLLVGNKLAAGTATAAQVVFVKSYDEAVLLFGQHSQLAEMVKAYKAVDRLTELWCIPMADAGGGAKSTGDWTLSGTATADGTVHFYISGRKFSVAVTSGDAHTAVVTAAVTAAAELSDLPVAVTDATLGVLQAESVHAGAFGDQMRLNHSLGAGEALPAGITIVLTQPTGGSGDVDHDTVVTEMGEDQYHTVGLGVHTAAEVAKIVTEMESREGPMRQIEGVVFSGVADSQANISTYMAGFNTSVLVVASQKKDALIQTPWEVAAQTAGLNAARVQVDPAKNLAGASYSGVSAAARGNRFTRAERDTLISDGAATTKAGSDGRLLVERLVTTQTTNASALPDLSFQDLTTVRTLHAIRFTIRAAIAAKYSQKKLADDGNVGPSVITPSDIRAELISLFLGWQDLGWVENLDQYKDELLVQRDGSDPNRVNAIIPPDIINQFYVFAGQIQFLR